MFPGLRYFPNSDPLALMYLSPSFSAITSSIINFYPNVSKIASVTWPFIPTYAINCSNPQPNKPVESFKLFAYCGKP